MVLQYKLAEHIDIQKNWEEKTEFQNLWKLIDQEIHKRISNMII